jgi:ribonuclease III
MNYLHAVESAIGYTFKDKKLLERALRHCSLHGVDSNERLEFLGDRILGLALADFLYRKDTVMKEGDMARLFNQLARKETCAEVAKSIKLGEAMVLSRGERHTGGNQKISILADACEALIAAVYLDSSWETVCALVNRLWNPHQAVLKKEESIDPKTRLQEWAQAKGLGLPVYEVIKREGPDHEPLFTVQVTIARFESFQGKGSSRRLAERVAAHLFLTHHG